MLGMTAPPQLILGALLVACSLPEGSGLAVVREETVGNSTMSKSELRALLRVERAELQAKMNKSGIAARWPFDEKPWDLWGGTYVNCLQTVLTATEPIWSMIEGIVAVAASCKGKYDHMECAEASTSLSETLLGAVGYLMDFPTDCSGYSCAIKKNTEDDRVHPEIYKLTMNSARVDAVGAIVGIGAAGLGKHLQCVKERGDSLGLPEKSTSPWVHPSLASFAPSVKELRETIQIIKSHGPSTRVQQVEKVVALGERVSGAVQSWKEVQMHQENNKDTPDTNASAKEGCVAAEAHIASSSLALLGSILKSWACWRGELELPADINNFGYKKESKVVGGKKDPNSNPRPSSNSKMAQISGGGMDVEISSGAGGAPCVPNPLISLDEYCKPFMNYYNGDMQIKNSKGRMIPTGKACRQKCCDKKSYPDVTAAQVKRILNSDYCTELE